MSGSFTIESDSSEEQLSVLGSVFANRNSIRIEWGGSRTFTPHVSTLRSKLKYLISVITSLLALSPLFVNAAELEISRPNTAVTLPMENGKGSAFYSVDGDRYNVVVAFTVGSEEKEKLVRQVVQMTDGQTYRVSIGGFGDDQQATTIKLMRKNGIIQALVVSCASRETISDCL